MSTAPDTAMSDVLLRLDALTAAVERLADAKGMATAKWLTVSQATVHSALSETSVRELLAAGKLTGHRPVKGRVLIDRAELDSYIAGATARPRKGRGIVRAGEVY